MSKRIIVLRAQEGDRRAFVEALTEAVSSVDGAELYVTEPGPRAATAVVCARGQIGREAGSVLATYEVDDCEMWDEPIAGAVHSMFALFRPAPGLDHEVFVQRYRQHAAVAREHHPGIRRYVQDLITEQSGEDRWMFAAISELHFAGPDEYRERFWLGDASREIVAADVERFSDGTTAKTVVAPRIPLAPVLPSR